MFIFSILVAPPALIGGIAETQEMLDFRADRGIVCDIESIGIDQADEAYDRMLKQRREIPVRHLYEQNEMTERRTR